MEDPSKSQTRNWPMSVTFLSTVCMAVVRRHVSRPKRVKTHASLGTETTITIDPNVCIHGSASELDDVGTQSEHTFSLDFFTLGEVEVWGQEFGTVSVGH